MCHSACSARGSQCPRTPPSSVRPREVEVAPVVGAVLRGAGEGGQGDRGLGILVAGPCLLEPRVASLLPPPNRPRFPFLLVSGPGLRCWPWESTAGVGRVFPGGAQRFLGSASRSLGQGRVARCGLRVQVRSAPLACLELNWASVGSVPHPTAHLCPLPLWSPPSRQSSIPRQLEVEGILQQVHGWGGPVLTGVPGTSVRFG